MKKYLIFYCSSIISINFVSFNLFAVCETPAKKKTLMWQPYQWDFGNYGGPCNTTSWDQHYGIDLYAQTADPDPGPSSNITVAKFKELLESGDYGIVWIHTHGETGIISIEPYAPTPEGEAARDAKYNTYVMNGWASYIDPAAIWDNSTLIAYDIGVNTLGISTWFTSDGKPIVYVLSCNSSSVAQNFQSSGARDALGYTYDMIYMLGMPVQMFSGNE